MSASLELQDRSSDVQSKKRNVERGRVHSLERSKCRVVGTGRLLRRSILAFATHWASGFLLQAVWTRARDKARAIVL